MTRSPTLPQKTLVFLTGPPAVGKMAVGRELSSLTGLPLFHNHLSIEAILPVFGFGHPALNRLVTRLRQDVIAEVADSDLPGVIFTYVWAHDQPSDKAYVAAIRDIFEAKGGRVVYPELWADLDTRVRRNATQTRLDAKSSKRDVDASREHLIDVDHRYRLSSDGDFPFEPHLFIDNTNLSEREAAVLITTHFGLGQAEAGT